MSDKGHDSNREAEELVGRLANFTTRAAARRRLVQLGAAAVPALIGALDSPVEGVAWCAAKSLGEIGDESALEPLRNALGREGLSDAVSEAIAAITGEEGAESRPPARPAGAASAQRLSDEDIVSGVSGAGVSATRRGAGYTFTVAVPGGRSQRVEMMLSLKDTGGAPLVAFYTECGPAETERFEWALKSNLRIPFGAFAIRESSDGDKLVMVDAYLRESASVRQLRSALESLAQRADAVERLMGGTDEN
jgi:hypothetical protein